MAMIERMNLQKVHKQIYMFSTRLQVIFILDFFQVLVTLVCYGHT